MGLQSEREQSSRSSSRLVAEARASGGVRGLAGPSALVINKTFIRTQSGVNVCECRLCNPPQLHSGFLSLQLRVFCSGTTKFILKKLLKLLK